MAKRPFIRKQKRKKHGATFWDHEYTEGGHLKLSVNPSEDLEKFTRWLTRQTGNELLNPTNSAIDVGCGNGRNLVFLAREFGMSGIGYDISNAAIKQAVQVSTEYNIQYESRSIAGPLKVPAESQTLVLDMMTSHFLNEAERTMLRAEAFAALKPGGYLFMKTFLRDGDMHTTRLLREFGTDEEGTYMHPVMGMAEHAYYEAELLEFLGEQFEVRKLYRSHKHVSHGRARKRRTISVYAQKPLW